MKPGNIKTDLGIGRAHQVEDVPALEPKPRVDLERAPDLAKSQLPEAPSSRTETSGESAIVRAHLQRQEEARKGKRQKLLKVAEAKTLAKAARAAFKALADLMGRAASILERFTRKLFDDEEEGEQQKRRRQHEEAIEEVEELKIDPSEVPRGLKPLTT